MKYKNKYYKRERAWALANKDKVKEHKLKYANSKTSEENIYNRAKTRAKKLNREFSIELKDITIPEYCPILDIPLKVNKGGNSGNYNSPSLDRIDPNKGYIKGNIQVISHRANTMKNDASIEELRKFSKWIQNYLEE